MHSPRFLRSLSPEFLFGILNTLVWLLLALQVSAGVAAPLSESLHALQAVRVQVQ